MEEWELWREVLTEDQWERFVTVNIELNFEEIMKEILTDEQLKELNEKRNSAERAACSIDRGGGFAAGMRRAIISKCEECDERDTCERSLADMES